MYLPYASFHLRISLLSQSISSLSKTIISEMDRNHALKQLVFLRQSLFDQGLLDEQFVQLEELPDDANPSFVEEVVTLYYRDSARLLLNTEQSLQKNPLDFGKLDGYMHQFNGSSSSVGAKKVEAESTQFREYGKT